MPPVTRLGRAGVPSSLQQPGDVDAASSSASLGDGAEMSSASIAGVFGGAPSPRSGVPGAAAIVTLRFCKDEGETVRDVLLAERVPFVFESNLGSMDLRLRCPPRGTKVVSIA